MCLCWGCGSTEDCKDPSEHVDIGDGISGVFVGDGILVKNGDVVDNKGSPLSGEGLSSSSIILDPKNESVDVLGDAQADAQPESTDVRDRTDSETRVLGAARDDLFPFTTATTF
jgi:hypothetical protein